jgi:hypothetical protein
MSVIREAATGRSQPLILYDQYTTGALTRANHRREHRTRRCGQNPIVLYLRAAAEVLDRFKVNIII